MPWTFLVHPSLTLSAFWLANGVLTAVILDIDRVPKFGKLSWDDRFYLEITVDDNGVSQKVRSQGLREKKSLMWDTTFTL